MSTINVNVDITNSDGTHQIVTAASPQKVVLTITTGAPSPPADTTPPTVLGVTTLNATTLRAAISEPMTSTLLGWTFKKNNVAIPASSIVGSGSDLIDFVVPALTAGDIITYSYSGGDAKDEANNMLASITDAAVTNTLTPISGVAENLIYSNTTTLVNTNGIWSGTATGNNSCGLTAKKIAAGTDGMIYAKYASGFKSRSIWFGFNFQNVLVPISTGIEAALGFTGDQLMRWEAPIFYPTIPTGAIIPLNSFFGIRRDGNVLNVVHSLDEVTWVVVSTFNVTYGGDLFPWAGIGNIDELGQLCYPKGVNLVSI